jgi:hypothetical protein
MIKYIIIAALSLFVNQAAYGRELVLSLVNTHHTSIRAGFDIGEHAQSGTVGFAQHFDNGFSIAQAMSTRITGRFDMSHYTSETTISYIRKPEDRDGFVFSGKTTVRMKHDSGGYSLTHLPELALGFETTGVSLFGRTSLKFLETGELARSRTSLDLSIGRRSTLLFRGVHEYEPAHRKDDFSFRLDVHIPF